MAHHSQCYHMVALTISWKKGKLIFWPCFVSIPTWNWPLLSFHEADNAIFETGMSILV